MIDLGKVRNYYIACGRTDLRLGIDSLAAVVTQQFGGHLDKESQFLFCSRRTDRIKALYWCGDGYILLYKRLSNGKFQWPRSEAELRLLDPQSFQWLMEGLKMEQKTAWNPLCSSVPAESSHLATQRVTPRKTFAYYIQLYAK